MKNMELSIFLHGIFRHVYARTASIALSNIFTPLLQSMADAGGITQLLKNDQGVRNGAYLYNGMLTNETLGQKFGIISKDLDLLISAF